jgi:glycosyltransferase involved in cell wall biosynthesis
MENKPLLSICIPIWNRWYCLGLVIEHIVNQPEFHSWKIELVISDNASDDNTENIVKSYQGKYTNIRYFRNETNIWAMPNISKVISMGKGEYIWPLWSDDLILNWWFKATLAIIEKYNPSLIIHSTSIENRSSFLMNYEKNYDTDHKALIFNWQREYLNYLWDWYINDKSWFMETWSPNLSFLSILCIKRSNLEKAISEIKWEKWENFLKKFNFIHTLLAHYSQKKDKIVFITEPFVESAIMSDTKWAKESWWKPWFNIANDICYLNNYLAKRHSTNKNFKKLRNKINLYWQLGALLNRWFIYHIHKLFEKTGLLSKIHNLIKKI